MSIPNISITFTATDYPNFAQHFGFFLPLAGISTIKEIKDNPIDVRATGRLNKLYIELLKDNPEWSTAARRHDMNHFMARLTFCFFAEDTDIFHGSGAFAGVGSLVSSVGDWLLCPSLPKFHERQPYQAQGSGQSGLSPSRPNNSPPLACDPDFHFHSQFADELFFDGAIGLGACK